MIERSKQFKIKAVLFDWDLTLGAALGDISAVERTVALLRQVGLNYDSAAIAAARTQRQAQIEQGQLPGPLAPQTKADLIVYYQQLLSLLGHAEPSPQLGEQVYNTYAHLPFVFYPDTLPAFRALAGRSLKLGIITNHSPDIRSVIEAKLGEFVQPEHIIISGEIGLYKPGRAIFLEGATCLGMPTEHCLYVGDNLEVDAVGAVKAGGYACGLWCDRSPQPAPENLPQAVYRITELGQVLNWVDTRSGQ
ncbi:MAG: HAD family hydrolase [Chloroflexi bacterium]|nr:HAD family hydrolase [Chloroflexota bacterium]